jgi:hypothetical protein
LPRIFHWELQHKISIARPLEQVSTLSPRYTAKIPCRPKVAPGSLGRYRVTVLHPCLDWSVSEGEREWKPTLTTPAVDPIRKSLG